MIEEAKAAIKKSSLDSSVYVGCDSVRFKKNGRWFARYATVIIVHHATRHGASIYSESVTLDDYGNLKTRLMNEVMFAVNAAMEIVDDLNGRHLEVHLDLNPNPKHKSNIAVKEALGYVQGSVGIPATIKPDAWAASHASDHFARGKYVAT
jgi:predicted RNase H-related nuclease YkuK (DUF458 family)